MLGLASLVVRGAVLVVAGCECGAAGCFATLAAAAPPHDVTTLFGLAGGADAGAAAMLPAICKQGPNQHVCPFQDPVSLVVKVLLACSATPWHACAMLQADERQTLETTSFEVSSPRGEQRPADTAIDTCMRG